MNLETFRTETREWLAANCPESMRNQAFHWEDAHEYYDTDDARLWLERMASKGWTAPTWPSEYSGGGLSLEESQVLAQEMAAIKAMPASAGMGLSMIGPTLLEFGNEEQKQRHIPRIVRGEVSWCQGYSEPGAGSDLASVQTKAVLEGDHFVINGQKIWTSGAQHADWMFALVRTNPTAPKHEGISFVLLDMHQPGVSIKPIQLISGSSPFCETFFDNALASRDDLVGDLNHGWTVGKRLLQYERSGIGGIAGPGEKKKKKAARPQNPYAQLAKHYLGESAGRVSDPAMRDRILNHTMMEKALQLTAQRTMETSKSGKAPGAVTSIFKYIGSTLSRDGSDLKATLMGTQGGGWEGDGFSETELSTTRDWLRNRAVTIYGGTNEVQLNIISKRVLGLPD